MRQGKPVISSQQKVCNKLGHLHLSELHHSQSYDQIKKGGNLGVGLVIYLYWPVSLFSFHFYGGQ